MLPCLSMFLQLPVVPSHVIKIRYRAKAFLKDEESKSLHLLKCAGFVSVCSSFSWCCFLTNVY